MSYLRLYLQFQFLPIHPRYHVDTAAVHAGESHQYGGSGSEAPAHAPGERVNRPDFGTGVMQLVFAPNSQELATATEFTIQGALQQWLGDRIQVEAVQVESEDSTLRITVQYILRRTQQRSVAQFSREV